MSDDLKRLDTADLEDLMYARWDEEDAARGLIVVNRRDIVNGMWNATWEICFGHYMLRSDLRYRAAADCESDALDEVIDWLEEHDEETLGEMVIDPDTFAAMPEDETQDIEFAGNHGYPLDPDLDITVMLVKRHKYWFRGY